MLHVLRESGMAPFACACCLHMFIVTDAEAACGLADVGFATRLAFIAIDTLMLHLVAFRLIARAKN